VLYAVGIFVASSMPSNSLPSGSWWHFDKLLHALAYAGLALLVMRAWGRYWPSVLVVALYGASDELHQLFTPGRSSEVLDVAADLVGALVGAGLYLLITHLGRRRHGDPAQLRR
jgi:VanZ family protein